MPDEVISRNLACDQLVTEVTNLRSEQFFAAEVYQEFFESRNVTSRTYPPVKGRIKARAEYWVNTLQASDPVIRIVKQGYSLPLSKFPKHIRPLIKHQHMNMLHL